MMRMQAEQRKQIFLWGLKKYGKHNKTNHLDKNLIIMIKFPDMSQMAKIMTFSQIPWLGEKILFFFPDT